MTDISFLLKSLSSRIIRSQIVAAHLPDVEGIILLNSQNSLAPGYIFLARGEELGDILARISPSGPATIFTSGDYGELPHLEGNREYNLIATSLDIFDLYNHIHAVMNEYRKWSDTFIKAMVEGKDLKFLFDQAGAMIKAPMFLLNASYRIICSTTDYFLKDTLVDELFNKECLSMDSIQRLFGKRDFQSDSDAANIQYFSSDTQNTYNIEILTHEGNAVAFLIIVTNEMHSKIDITNFASQMAGWVKRLLLVGNVGSSGANTAFASIISDLIELRLTEEEEIQDRFKAVHYPLKEFTSCIVIEFAGAGNEKTPFSCIISQLQQILPGNNITVYDGDIIILFSYNERTWHFEMDYEKLGALLSRYNAYAGMSNGSRKRTKIRTAYLLAKNTLRLGKVLGKDKSKRIFTHEEYSMYCIIDLCAKNFYEIYKHKDIIYLSHPAVIAITRYDRKYKTNLRDILFCYLINDRNLIKTSRALYMHRNTTLNKINKITEIVGESLDNGELQLRLLFSCLLIRYFEEYMKENINS